MTIKSIHYAVIVVLGIAFQPIPLPGQDFQVNPQSKLSGATDSINITHTAYHPGPYSLDYNREFILLGSGAVMGISGLVLMNNVTPLTAEEIARLDPNDINPFDRHAIGQYRDVEAGDALLYASFLLPLSFLADERTKRDWKTLGVIGIDFNHGSDIILCRQSIFRLSFRSYGKNIYLGRSGSLSGTCRIFAAGFRAPLPHRCYNRLCDRGSYRVLYTGTA